MDGVQRTYSTCFDLYVYNFTIGFEAREELHGCERLRRSEKTCEASDLEGELIVPASHSAGNEVDCWRPKIGFANLSVRTLSCGRPECTAADIYSCSDPNCVQLTDPAEEFLLTFGDPDIWARFGIGFLLAGFLVILSVIFSELFQPQAVTCVINRSVEFSLLSVFVLVVYITSFHGDVLSFETVLKYVDLHRGVYFTDLFFTTMYFSALEEISLAVRSRVMLNKILNDWCSEDFSDDDENRNRNDEENRNAHDEETGHANDDENRFATDGFRYTYGEEFTFDYMRRMVVLCLVMHWYFDILNFLSRGGSIR
jgi:hypothetical protein